MFEKNLGTELKVGIFTVCGLAVMGVLVVTLRGNPFGTKEQTFYTVLDNVGGVGQRTQVRTSGVQVGEVNTIDILPKGARVNFKVDGAVAIPKGSFIELRSRGILGDVYLEIVRNENSTDKMKSGDLIPKIKEFNDMSSLMNSLGSIAQDIQTVSRTLAKVLGTGDGQSSLQNILNNVEQITSDSRDLMASERKNISAMLAAFRESSERVNNLLARNDARIDDILGSVADASRDAKAFTTELRKLVSGDNKGKIESIVASVDDSMKSIRQASAKVQLIVDKVERGEGSIGQLVSKDDTANDLRATLKSVQDILKPAAKLKLEIDYRGELRSAQTPGLGRTANHFNVRLSTRPDRYYLLGISDSPMAHKVTTTNTVTSTAADGSVKQTVLESKPEDRPRLRYNAQFAKRFDAVGVRFGLFESYAGVAGDLYLFGDRVQASLEVFNLGDDRYDGPNSTKGFARVKGYGNMFFTPNLYVSAGADNIGKSTKPLAFLGVGLRFTDEDLKAVIGAAALAK